MPPEVLPLLVPPDEVLPELVPPELVLPDEVLLPEFVPPELVPIISLPLLRVEPPPDWVGELGLALRARRLRSKSRFCSSVRFSQPVP